MKDKKGKDYVRKRAMEAKLTMTDDGTEYINNTTKFKFVDNEGYLYSLSLANINNCIASGSSNSKFGRGNIYTKENMYNWIKLNAHDKIEIIYLSSESVSSMSKNILVRCKECGKEIWKSWNNISSKHFCPSCSNKGLEYSIHDIEKMVNKNVIILNGYNGIKEKAQCKCRVCGYEWGSSTFDSLVNRKSGCPKCDKKRRNGDTSPSWKGGITPLYSNIRSFMLPWKIDSYLKYNHTCDISRIKLNSNIIHHHYNYSDILKESLIELSIEPKGAIGNYSSSELELIKSKCLELHYRYGLGVCLTKEIHEEFHKIYGKRNNTIEQYLEFKNNKLKEKENEVENNNTIANIG